MAKKKVRNRNGLFIKSISTILCSTILAGIVSSCSFSSESMQAGFIEGWNAAVEYLGTTVAATETDDYISQVQVAIDEFAESINEFEGSQQDIPQLAGYVAERWHAGTFNIDAALNESIYSAEVPASTELGSADIIVYDDNGNSVIDAGLKYYRTGTESARAQAITILQAYKNSGSDLSFQEYCESHGYDSDIGELYSLYYGQTRIIPEDQLQDAINYLNNKADLPDGPYSETLKNLKDKLETPDGTSSEPYSLEEMYAVAQLAQEGEFDPTQFGYSVDQLITPKYVVKQAVSGGLSSAAYELVLSVGPDLFSVIRESLRTGTLDVSQLRELGVDGLMSSSVGFVEGAASSLILSACQTGKLGPGLVGATPEMVGAFVHIVKQSIRYSYALSQGEISSLEYGDLMAENVLIIVCSTGAGIALETLLPALPMAYSIGSLVGGMIASIGYKIIKDSIDYIILFFKGAGGFETAIATTEEVEDIDELPIETVDEVDVFYELSSAEDLSINLAKDGGVTIGLDAEYFCPNCDAVLNDMDGFDPDLGYYYCEDCGMLLYGGDIYDGERYPGVIWFCDECNSCLSMQEGFSDLDDEWECTECGYVNSITEEYIW